MIILTPAYGRDYKSIKALKVDVKANKDFMLNQGINYGLCSPSDFKGQRVLFRYSKLMKTTIIKIEKGYK